MFSHHAAPEGMVLLKDLWKAEVKREPGYCPLLLSLETNQAKSQLPPKFWELRCPLMEDLAGKLI